MIIRLKFDIYYLMHKKCTVFSLKVPLGISKFFLIFRFVFDLTQKALSELYKALRVLMESDEFVNIIFKVVRQCNNTPQTIHHTQEVLDALNATGALILFLPPYSPDFMPCEELFSQTKHFIRQNDVAWQNCPNPELMVYELFFHVTDDEIKN